MKAVNDTQEKEITVKLTYDEAAAISYALKQSARTDAEIQQMLHKLRNPAVKGGDFKWL